MTHNPDNVTTQPQSNYSQIVRSTLLVGGASVVTVLIGVARTKLLAITTGPNGVGIYNSYTSICTIATTLSGLGISTSGVKEIAEASSSGCERRLVKTTITLKRASLVFGFVGAILLAFASPTVSLLTFGNATQSTSIAWLSVHVFFSTVATGLTAIIQGMRRITDLVRATIIGALFGAALGVPFVWFNGESGIVWMMVTTSVVNLLFTWFYLNDSTLNDKVSWLETTKESKTLVSLGVLVMGSMLFASVAGYLNQVLIIRHEGIEALGNYSAAYSLASVYVSFILQAMGKDLFPNIAAHSHSPSKCNEIVNQQTEVALLMAAPGLVLTLLLAPSVIRVFYSDDFSQAASVLNWVLVGVLGRLVSWPMAYLLIALGRRREFLFTEVAASIANVGLTWWGLKWFGINGAGMAFAALYVFYVAMMRFVVSNETGFSWSPQMRNVIAWTSAILAGVFAIRSNLPGRTGLVLGFICVAVSIILSLRGLAARLPNLRLGRLERILR